LNPRERVQREREIKRELVKVMKEAGIDPKSVSEWLWEDFGKRVKPEWGKLEKAVLEDDVTPQDVALFLDEAGVEIDDERIWRREYEAVRRGQEDTGGG